MITAQSDAMRSVTGDAFRGCPWRVYEDDFVIDVLRAYAFMESGEVSMWLGADPPNAIAEGLRHYHVALGRIRADEMEREQKKREQRTAMATVDPGGGVKPPPKPATVALEDLKLIGDV